jgi:hypothetical protein
LAHVSLEGPVANPAGGHASSSSASGEQSFSA